MISSGTESIAWRTKKVPKALTAKGTMSAPIVFTSPAEPSIVNTGTKVTWGGMSRQAMTNPKAARRPTNRVFASA